MSEIIKTPEELTAYGINFRLPKMENRGDYYLIEPRNTPDVFPVEVATLYEGTRPIIMIHSPWVMMGHGIVRKGCWEFVDGGSVKETVDAYFDYRLNHPDLPLLDIVIACNYPSPKSPVPLSLPYGVKKGKGGLYYYDQRQPPVIHPRSPVNLVGDRFSYVNIIDGGR